ncbi:hypothetical protein N7E70_020225 [Aminobacter sp. NyZ550]|uniref:hypothetical protein n=1 Tax=Aminobacter sp. NyZ550 TaxID=2979870 RepID=UPI0021D5F076|nr:hypothetical protein [Aminobacter sp. NyZ550]WAX93991.1 hypothetical protein N7E70_020225 [Aminobacter sp. NyZ550]WMC99157.1 hypothetical protein RAR13_10875 [Aminobacter aminovorans]
MKRELFMKRELWAFCLAIALGAPLAAPVPAQALDISISVGTSLNHGRAISCSQGQRLLQNRGFRDVRRVDCRGRFFIYHARRGSGRFEVALSSRTGRVTDVRRIRW